MLAHVQQRGRVGFHGKKNTPQVIVQYQLYLTLCRLEFLIYHSKLLLLGSTRRCCRNFIDEVAQSESHINKHECS